MIRRILFFQTIVKRSDNELTKKVFKAQMADPIKGEDFAFMEKDLNEEEAKSKSKIEYKNLIKTMVKEKVFEKFKNIQDSHSKVKELKYNTFKIQEYMISRSLTDIEVSFLFSLRSRTVKSVRNNF